MLMLGGDGNVFNVKQLLRRFVGGREFENYLSLLFTCPVSSIQTSLNSEKEIGETLTADGDARQLKTSGNAKIPEQLLGIPTFGGWSALTFC